MLHLVALLWVDQPSCSCWVFCLLFLLFAALRHANSSHSSMCFVGRTHSFGLVIPPRVRKLEIWALWGLPRQREMLQYYHSLFFVHACRCRFLSVELGWHSYGREKTLLHPGCGMEARVAAGPSRVICLAVVSITCCLLSKQKMRSVSQRA